MCGICGFIGDIEPSVLPAMIDAIAHRGPDGQGEHREDFILSSEGRRLHLGLGHRRLSVIDLSEAGRQPMSNEDGTIWITFNGEIYNFLELRHKLQKTGHSFKSRTDTEAILHLYEEKGEECVHELQGMFTFAIWDRTRQKLFIARDRLGIKPLYYVAEGENLVFASELKALLRSSICSREIDQEALLHFLTFLYVPSPMSIFKAARKLAPGHCLVWEKGIQRSYRYWKLQSSFAGPYAETDGSIEVAVSRRLEETVASHLVSDVPIGVFLSGGMDSGSIVGLMRKVTNQPVKTFSIGYGPEASSYNELAYSRLTAKHFETEHHEFILKPDVADLLPRIVYQMDEPFADSSAIPSYLVSQVARQHVKVALSGIGGDELFGGYPRYLGARLGLMYDRCPAVIRKAITHLTDHLPESTSSRNLPGRIKRFFLGATLSREECYLRWISFLSSDQARNLLSPGFASAVNGTDVMRHHHAWLMEFSRAGCCEAAGRSCLHATKEASSGLPAGDWVNTLQCLDIMTYLPDDLLIMGDKMSMAHGLEVRVPFCDHLLVHSMMAIPSSIKYRGFKLKSLMKSSVRDLLPREIIAHRKQGFMVPLAIWIKEDLHGLVEDLLSRERVTRRGYFRYEQVRSILDEHYNGKQNLTDLIYALLVLELWHQLYID